MGGNSRTLVFEAEDLEESITLMLMFNPPPSGKLYKTLFPVCYKVVTLTAGPNSKASVTWDMATAFFTPQINKGNLVDSLNSALVETGQKCIVTEIDGRHTVGKATPGTPGIMQCKNGTSRPVHIGIGNSNPHGGNVKPALVWKDVAASNNVTAEMTPILLIYSTQDYKETQIIRGAIESPNLFPVVDGPGVNLIKLKDETVYKVSIDPHSGNIVFKNEN